MKIFVKQNSFLISNVNVIRTNQGYFYYLVMTSITVQKRQECLVFAMQLRLCLNQDCTIFSVLHTIQGCLQGAIKKVDMMAMTVQLMFHLFFMCILCVMLIKNGQSFNHLVEATVLTFFFFYSACRFLLLPLILSFLTCVPGTLWKDIEWTQDNTVCFNF